MQNRYYRVDLYLHGNARQAKCRCPTVRNSDTSLYAVAPPYVVAHETRVVGEAETVEAPVRAVEQSFRRRQCAHWKDSSVNAVEDIVATTPTEQVIKPSFRSLFFWHL